MKAQSPAWAESIEPRMGPKASAVTVFLALSETPLSIRSGLASEMDPRSNSVDTVSDRTSTPAQRLLTASVLQEKATMFKLQTMTATRTIAHESSHEQGMLTPRLPRERGAA